MLQGAESAAAAFPTTASSAVRSASDSQSRLRSTSSNPFRSSSSGRDNHPSFDDCFAGFDATRVNLLSEHWSSASPQPFMRGTPRPTHHDAAAALGPTPSPAKADFSFATLNLSAEEQSASMTPPRRIEREPMSSVRKTPMSAAAMACTPQRPPLYPGYSPAVSPVYATSVPRNTVAPRFIHDMMEPPSKEEQEEFQRSLREAAAEAAEQSRHDGVGEAEPAVKSGASDESPPTTQPPQAAAAAEGNEKPPAVVPKGSCAAAAESLFPLFVEFLRSLPVESLRQATAQQPPNAHSDEMRPRPTAVLPQPPIDPYAYYPPTALGRSLAPRSTLDELPEDFSYFRPDAHKYYRGTALGSSPAMKSMGLLGLRLPPAVEALSFASPLRKKVRSDPLAFI